MKKHISKTNTVCPSLFSKEVWKKSTPQAHQIFPEHLSLPLQYAWSYLTRPCFCVLLTCSSLTSYSFLFFKSATAMWLQPFPYKYKPEWPSFWLFPGHLPLVCSLDIGHDFIPWKSFYSSSKTLPLVDGWLLPLCQSFTNFYLPSIY